MEYLKEGFGLVTERDQFTENSNLFYAQYLALKTIESADVDFFSNNMRLKLNDRGVYNRRSIEPLPVRSVSKDEILGFMTASKLLKTDHAEEIWQHLLKTGGSYNNTGRLFDYLPFNPGNYYNWGQLVGSKLSYLFLPIFVANLLIACNKPASNTSSKIMYWLIFKTLPTSKLNNFMCRYYKRKMKAQYGENYLRGLYEIYFSMESRIEFPLFKLTGE